MSDQKNVALVLLTPGGLPVLEWGPPGGGKMAKKKALAKAMNAHLEITIPSVREPSDYFGLNIPVDGNGLKVEPPGWAYRAAAAAATGKRSWVLHDEISTAVPAVQAALLRVMLEGVVGELTMDGVKQFAAANPPDQAAGGWEMALPLANRFTHLIAPVPSNKEWTDWLLGESKADQEAAALADRFDLKEWEKCFERTKALFAGFLRHYRANLWEDPVKVQGRFPMAYCTPRTMEAAVRLYATCLHLGALDRAEVLLSGTIGEPVAVKFLAWVREADLPDPEELLAKPEKWVPDANRDDRTFAVLTAIAVAATDKTFKDKEYLKRWIAAWKVIDRTITATASKDLVIIAGRKLAARENRPKEGLKDQTVRNTVSKLADVIQASGLMDE
jgi:hypothetical protein